MTHGALFNGIAGFPLAAAWAGIETTWTVEIDEFCNKVSKKHFPNALQYTDIHDAKNLPYVDIISGGFPCQPFSVAGKQLGNEDDRALWPQMLRVIREVRPKYVIGENVTGIISMALDDVLTSLEAEGYATETFVVPAVSVGAPHRRDRVWIIGTLMENACDVGCGGPEILQKQQGGTEPVCSGKIGVSCIGEGLARDAANTAGRRPIQDECRLCYQEEREGVTDNAGYACVATNSDSINRREQQQFRCGIGERPRHESERSNCETASNSQHNRCKRRQPSGDKAAIRCETTGATMPLSQARLTANPYQQHGYSSGLRAGEAAQQQKVGVFPMPDFRLTEPPVRGADDGLPAGLVRNRTHQLKAYGNAIVPQVAYQFFTAIKALEI